MSRFVTYTEAMRVAFRPRVSRGKEKKKRYEIRYSGLNARHGMRSDCTFAKTFKEAQAITSSIRTNGFIERHISAACGYVPPHKMHHTCIKDTKKNTRGEDGRFWLWHRGS